MFSLTDLTFSYPDVPDEEENMQNVLYSRKEFATLKSTAEPIIVNPGKYYPYQEIARRYLLPYDRVLLTQEPGTGKSCSQIGIAEVFNLWDENYDITVNWRQNYKRVYIVVFSELLVSEMEYQFICRCTDGRYYTDSMKQDLKSTGRTLSIRAQLDVFYSIITYKQFYDMITRTTPESSRIEKFDNCIFMLDEAHFFRNNFQLHNKRSMEIYNTIYNLLASLSNFKLVLSTATPMIDSTNDIIPLLNLLNIGLLPRIPDDADINSWTEEMLAPYIEGKIMYVKSLPVGSEVHYVGQDIEVRDGITTKVVPLLMSQWQSDRYMEKFERISQLEGQETRVYIDNRLSSAIELPDKWKFLSEPLNTGTVEIRKDFADDMKKNLGKYSCKFEYIINYINEQNAKGDRKLYFIYWDLLKGGLNELASILISMGWEYYDGSNSVFQTKVVRDGVERISYVSSYCSTVSSDGTRELTPFHENFPAGVKRFSILSGELSVGIQSKNIKETFTHPDNRYGDYVQILIGSKVTKLGINLLNVTEMFFIGPSWNYGDFYQAMYRILRAQSHVELLRDRQREQIISDESGEGIVIADESDIKIRVNIHKLCALPRYIPEEALPRGMSYSKPTEKLLSYLLNHTEDYFVNGKSPAIDVFMYKIAEEKEINIRRVFRILKIYAIDCPMNKERNMTGIDGTVECDYRKCSYNCRTTLKKDEIGKDITSYRALYVGDIMKRMEDFIILTLKSATYLLWEDVLNEFPEHREDIVQLKLIPRMAHRLFRRIITDRFGFPRFIMLNDVGIVATVNSDDVLFDFYPFIGKDVIIYNRDVKLNEIFLQELYSEPVDLETLQDIQNGLVESEIFKQKILENTWKRIIDGEEKNKEIIDKFYEVFYYYLVETQTRQFRIVDNQTIISILRNRTSYLHFFFNDISDYSLVTLTRNVPKSLENRIRIYDQNTKSWRNVNESEIILYGEAINEHIQKTVAPYGDVYMYFNVIKNTEKVVTPVATIRIMQGREEKSDDNRSIPRGTNIHSMDIVKLIRTYTLLDARDINDFVEVPEILEMEEASKEDKKEYDKIVKNNNYHPVENPLEYDIFSLLKRYAGGSKSIVRFASTEIDNRGLFMSRNKFFLM